jgi:hypothetical protein
LTTKSLFHRLSLRRNTKGVSTIFGMVFFLLIVVIVFASFAVVLNQSTSLEATMIQSRQMDLDKAKELLVLKPVIADNVFWINNSGTTPAQVVRLWASDANGGNPIWQQVLPAQQIILPNQELPFGPLAGASGKFRCWVVTARGNQFSYLVQGGKGQDGKNGMDGIATGALSAAVAFGIGSISMDFEHFYGYNYASSGTSVDFTSRFSGYNLAPGTSSTKIIFAVNVTNMDPYDRQITLSSPSVFFSVMPYIKNIAQPIEAAAWYIVNVNPETGAISSTFNPITFQRNQSTWLYFAALYDTVVIPFQNAAKSGADTSTLLPNGVNSIPAPINLALMGTVGNATVGPQRPFGQNLPFVSIYVNR